MNTSLYPELPVLLVDDEEAWLHSFSLALKAAGVTHIHCHQDSRSVLQLLKEQRFSTVVLDLIMPHVTGEEILPRIVEEHPEIPVLVLTGLDLVDSAVNCMKLGAFDYYTKVSEEDRMVSGVKRALDFVRLRRENSSLKEIFLKDALNNPEAFSHIITHNKAMHSIFQYMEAIAPTSESVLITGETGVGKELIARALHNLSGQKGEFVPVNAAGLDDTIFSDTLFGHRKGAFTGATESRPGLIERASGGTIFLDEIGDLPQASQVKLLRLLQEREYFQLGSDIARHTDARFVFATHHSLDRFSAEGRFRKDLFYRLSAHHIQTPPLRNRMDDLELLVDFFVQEAAERLDKTVPTYPKELLSLLGAYTFPGNVRELKNIIFDAVSRHRSKMLSLDDFKAYVFPEIQQAGTIPSMTRDDDKTPFSVLENLPTLKEAGSVLIREALRRASGNQSVAAGILGITRQALNWRLKQEEKE